MISPSSLIEVDNIKGQTGSVITFGEIPEYDQEDYDLSSGKDFGKYLKDVEKDVRGSIEYRWFEKFLRDYYNMYVSGSFDSLTGLDSGVKTEIHHTPFSLYDIVCIVYSKRSFYHEDVSLQMVAKEVMELHYKQLIGLYPLTQTEHEMVHNSFLFIPTYKIFGRYDIFKELYKPFIETDLLNTLDDIEDYSRVAFDEEKQKSMLSQSNVFLDTSGAYSLPILDKLKGAMTNRIDQIKQNAFMLPIFDEDTTTNPMDQTKPKMKEAIIFY